MGFFLCQICLEIFNFVIGNFARNSLERDVRIALYSEFTCVN